MAQTGTDVKTWATYMVWTRNDFEGAKEAQKALQSEKLQSWTHPPMQPECCWLALVSSDVLTPEQIEETLEANKDKYELSWEGPYFDNFLEENAWYPKKCVQCGQPTHYKYRSMEFEHPTDTAKGLDIPDDNELRPTLVNLICYDKFVYLCFQCLEGYIGDNEMTTGGTGIWMAMG